MLEFDWPWAFAGLLLPLLAWRLLPRAPDAGGTALRMPFYAVVVAVAGQASGSGLRARVWLPALAYLLLCVAAARPQWVGEIEMPPQSGRDLMLAVDVSGSMAAEDMAVAGRRVDRLQAVKVVIGDFLERRVGDRVGMILFGQAAYQITPLTATACGISWIPAASAWPGAKPPSAMPSVWRSSVCANARRNSAC